MLIILVLGVLSATVYAQYVSTLPRVLPLIHKAPYVNSWIDSGGNISTLVGHWPQLYNGRHLGWMIAARVDGTGYILQGAHANYTTSKVVAAFITPTRTIIMADAGPVRLNITYLTPIELDDWTRHSLPFGYFCIDLWSTDGKTHSVQLYSDISGEFLSPVLAETLTWKTTVTSTLMYHQMRLGPVTSILEYDRNDLQTRDGTQFFAFRTNPIVAATWQSCFSETCRNNFAQVGKLGNISDTNFRAMNNSLPVMAFALDLDNIKQSDSPLVFAIGLFNVTFWNTYSARSMEQRPLWWSRWNNIWDAIDSSLLDFPHTYSRAAALDTRIVSDTSVLASNLGLLTSVATNLTDLVIMSVRQAIGSLEITTNRTDQGSMKLDDIRVFMDDIGNSGRVSPLEVIYASFPAFLYFNSSLAGKLLEPLFEPMVAAAQSIGYDPGYAMTDLGDNWPVAQVNTDTQSVIGIESSSSMLILALAYTQKSGNKSLISRYYELLLKWAEFLVKNSLKVDKFETADGSIYATSNLALKGITGIYAMGKINQMLEGNVSGADTIRTSYYLDIAQNYSHQWKNLALSSHKNYITSRFGLDFTWGFLYNLYAVRLVRADLSPIISNVYEFQAAQIATYLKIFFVTDRTKCALVQYESSSMDTKMHWAMLAAGSIVQDTTGTRDGIIGNVHNFTFGSQTGAYANPSSCSPQGDHLKYSGNASAANGAAFVFHALSLPDLVTNAPPTTSVTPTQTSSPKSSRFDYKLGVILAVLVAITTLVGILFYWRRLSRQRRMTGSIDLPSGENHMTPYLELVTVTHQPSKRHVSEILARHPNVFLATNDQVDSHAKPSTLRRRTEVFHASTEPVPSSSAGDHPEPRVSDDAQEENLRRQVEQLRTELNEALMANGGPPPYTDDV